MTTAACAQSFGARYGSDSPWRPCDINLELEAGQTLLVIGPSGSGKSTLGLALARLIPDSIEAQIKGNITVQGRASAVFQDPDMQIVTSNVLDEVCFGPENLCLPEDEVLARARRALESMGLWARRGDNPSILSGGGKQRLAIASLLALEPDVMVLDEPTANLDPLGAISVRDAIAGLAGRSHTAVVVIEHNPDDFVDVADNLLALDKQGSVLAFGPARRTLIDREDDLIAAGVRLPAAQIATRQLRSLGVRIVGNPLTPVELETALPEDCPQEALDVAAAATFPNAVTGVETRLVRNEPIQQTPETNQEDRRHAVELSITDSSPRPKTRSTVFSMSQPVVEVHDLHIERGGRHTLEGVNLAIKPGTVTAFVGVNGSGKSTLLQAIVGIIKAPRHTVRVAGRDPARMRSRTRAQTVGFVFQNPEHQFLTYSVEDELASSLQNPGPARIDQILTSIGLRDKAHEHPLRLSGGEKRRLSVVEAALGGARVLVLDEPTYGQDQEYTDVLLDVLAKLRAQGVTIVLATHDLRLAAHFADHVGVLKGGRLAAYGPTDAIIYNEAVMDEAGLACPPVEMVLRRGLQGHKHGSCRSVNRNHTNLSERSRGTQTKRGGVATPAVTSGSGIPSGVDSGSGSSPMPDSSTSSESDVDPLSGGLEQPRFLERMNPLAIIAATIPQTIVVLFAGGWWQPLATLLISCVLLGVGSRLDWRAAVRVTLAVVLVAVVMTVSLSFWYDRGTADLPDMAIGLGPITWHVSGLVYAAGVVLRLIAVAALTMLTGVTSTISDLIHALNQQLRVPYRYTSIIFAALRFVPSMQTDFMLIRAARRMRPRSRTAHGRVGVLIPLIAGAIRRAERTALAMDTRGFGLLPQRTERHVMEFGIAEWTFMAVAWCATGAGLIASLLSATLL